jgi:DNA-binding LacI/PurR family transcriptional regulator
VAILKDIALKTDVSIRTVGRVLNGQGPVRGNTRERVLAAARELDYRPNRLARNLRLQRSMEIAIVMHSTWETYLKQIVGMDERLSQSGYTLTIFFKAGQDEESAVRSADDLINHAPAAVALADQPAPIIKAQVSRLAAAGIPYVVLDTEPDGFDAVAVDRPAGACEAVRYLAGRGHQRIAYLGDQSDAWGRTRSDGYSRAMGELGRAPIFMDMAHRPEETWFERSRAVGRTFPKAAPRPDAVLAFSDDVAMGFLAGLHDVRLQTPADVALVSFGGSSLVTESSPPLTAVAVPHREIGAAAAEILIAKIEGAPAPAEGWSRTLSTRLVVRESA